MSDASEELAVGANVDVRELMAEIHAEVERKRRAGLYPPEVMAELEVPSSRRSLDDPLEIAVRNLHRDAGFTSAVPTGSRKRFVAPFADGFKRAVRGSVQWYIIGILHQVERFAVDVVRATTLLAERVRALEASNTQHQIDEVRTDLLHKIEDVDNAISDLRSELLLRFERSLRGIRGRVSDARPPTPGTRPATMQSSEKADRAVDYLAFGSYFWGSEEQIRNKMLGYVDLFRDAPGPVLDLGCGRGEFLELLKESSTVAYGVDRHPDMVDRCKDKGLDVLEDEALSHLSGLEHGSLGGIFSTQMIEHLEIPDVPRLFELAADVLAPAGRLVIETLNPESLFVLARVFYLDLGHLRPLHPATLRFLAEQSGFEDIRIEYFSLPPDQVRPATIEAPESMRGVVDAVNENFRRIDEIVFGPVDYALVAKR